MKKGLYISGAIGLGALLGAGCIGGVRVDPVEGWDEPITVQQARDFGDLWGLYHPSAGDAWEIIRQSEDYLVIPVVAEPPALITFEFDRIDVEVRHPERIEYLEKQLKEKSFDILP